MKKNRSLAAMAKKPGFHAALQPDGTLEILIYGDIGEDYWSYDGGITAKAVKAQLDVAGNYANILMRINSAGGDVFEGIAIYNIIRGQKKPVAVCVDGIAASSASIIAMCGDTITMGPNTMMMIHNVWTICIGSAADMRKMADSLEKISGAVAQTYVTRTKKSLEEITALMDAETWMTAQECLAEGFATAIAAEPDQQVEENALAMARKFKTLARMKQVPEKLKASAADECQCPCAACVDGDCENCNNTECEDPNCEDCPMQGEASNAAAVPANPMAPPTPSASAVIELPKAADESNLSLYETRARMLLRQRV